MVVVHYVVIQKNLHKNGVVGFIQIVHIIALTAVQECQGSSSLSISLVSHMRTLGVSTSGCS